MMRPSTIRRLGGYSPKLTSAQDYELWTRVSLAGQLANLEEVHMLLRLHEGRVTYKHRAQQIAFMNDAKRRYLQVVLNRDVPGDVIDNLRRKPATAGQAAMAAAVIMDYCKYCSKGTPAPVALMIIGQTLEKTARTIRRFIIYPVTWKAGIRFGLLLLQFMGNSFRLGRIRFAGAFRRLMSKRKPNKGANFRYE